MVYSLVAMLLGSAVVVERKYLVLVEELCKGEYKGLGLVSVLVGLDNVVLA